MQEPEESANAETAKETRSIRTTLALLFLMFLGLVAGSTLLNMHQISTIGSATGELQSIALPRSQIVGEIELALTSHTLLAKQRSQTTDFRRLAGIIEQMEQEEAQFRAKLNELRPYLVTEEEHNILTGISACFNIYLTFLAGVQTLLEQGQLARAQVSLEGDTQAAIDAVFIELAHLIELSHQEVDTMSAAVVDAQTLARRLSAFAVVAGVVAATVALIWSSRHVSRPLLEISAAMRLLIEGKDEIQIPDQAHRLDEIGVLARAATAFRATMLATRDIAADLESERSRLSATIHNMPLGLCMFDKDGELIVWNAAFEEIWRFDANTLSTGTQKKIVGQMIEEQCDASTSGFVSTGLSEGLANYKSDSSILTTRDGRKVSVTFQPSAAGLIQICEDVSERIEQEEQIRFLAHKDPLTGLANRRAFETAIETALQHDSVDDQLAVLIIDLDRFKHINDTLGHPIGDQLLKAVSKRLNGLLTEDDFAARLGGDEFAVIQSGGNQPAAAKVLGFRINKELATPFEIEGHRIQIGGSIGVAIYPEHGTCADELQRNADLALYGAKGAGRGRCQIFDVSMKRQQKELHELEQALRTAVRTRALHMVYQPLFDLTTGQVCGAEALARWDDPDRGPIPPSRFIPLAEELHMIRSISAAMLPSAFRAAQSWPDHVYLSINLSPQQIHEGDIKAELLQALAREGLSPDRIEVEITEGVLLRDSSKTLETLSSLRAEGMSIALDDFGTGYSSLQYLRTFPFDRVKIDGSFMKDIDTDDRAADIIDAVTSLCKTFNIAVTAEGIETQSQLEFARKVGCAIGQGYFLGRPARATDMAEWFNRPKVISA